MSAEMDGESGVESCASCGVKEGADTKLKVCTACFLVKYCGVKCQKQHRKKHKRACKQRAAELRDEILFKQPESSDLGDCPICFLPHSIVPKKSTIMTCCSKVICNGCDYASAKCEIEGKLDEKCPFCRTPNPASKTEEDKRLKDRAEKNDPVAMCQLGMKCRDNGDYQNALQYFSKAAQLGDVRAHYELAILYHDGRSVEKDETKAVHHTEQAAIAGHPRARHNLSCIDFDNGRRERAIKHLIIAAKLGNDESLDNLKMAYKAGLVSKDDLAEALRGHQAAIDATKSPQREEAERAASLARAGL